MSKTGIVAVASKSGHQLHEEAMKARQRLLLPSMGRIVLPFQKLLEMHLRNAYEVELDVLDDDDPMLSGAHAAYNYAERCLKLRRSVHSKLPIEEPEACFTVCHEIGHIHLHSNPLSFRRIASNQLPSRWCDPEVQADRFAREFMFDREFIKDQNPSNETLARYFRMPVREMKLLLEELKAEGVLARPQKMDGEKYWEAQQGDFDF